MYRSAIGRQHALHSAATTPAIDAVVVAFLVDDVNDVVVVNDDTEDDIGDNVHADDVMWDDDVV